MNIVKQNKIIFKRIPDINILAYKITGKQTVNGQSVSSTLATIDNPTSPHPLKLRKKVEYNPTRIFTLEDDVYYNEEHQVSVYINGKQLIEILSLYNPEKKQVQLLYQNLTEFDIIEIEYYYDGIEFVHNANQLWDYSVEYIIDYSNNNVGDHNILI